jgi:hypothetical protein
VLWYLKLMHEYSKRAPAPPTGHPEWSMLSRAATGSGARWHLWIAIDHNDLELAGVVPSHGPTPAAPPAAKNLPGSLYEEGMRRGETEIQPSRATARRALSGPSASRNLVVSAMRLDRDAVRAQIEQARAARAPEPMAVAATRNRPDVVVRCCSTRGISGRREQAEGARTPPRGVRQRADVARL